jgi:simple sugar transport system permease protein
MTGLRRKLLVGLAGPLLAVVFSLLVGALALVLVDESPAEAYSAMWREGRKAPVLFGSLNRAIPLYIAAMAVAIGFKMGLFNIGVEGQYGIAALFAAAFGASVDLPMPLHIALIVAVAMLTGAAWAGIAGILKVTRGVSEVISTIMLNFIAIGAAQYLFRVYFRTTSTTSTQTDFIPESGRMPPVDQLFVALGISVPKGIDVNGFLLVAVLLGVLFYVGVWRTRFGYDLRASGLNPFAAQASGVAANAMVVKAMLISGALAGLVALPQILGSTYKYDLTLVRGLGFTGIAVALLGRNHPVGMAIAALLFGYLDRASQILQILQIPREIVTIVQGVIVLSVVVAYEIVRRIAERQLQRDVARQEPAALAPSAAGATA